MIIASLLTSLTLIITCIIPLWLYQSLFFLSMVFMSHRHMKNWIKIIKPNYKKHKKTEFTSLVLCSLHHFSYPKFKYQTKKWIPNLSQSYGARPGGIAQLQLWIIYNYWVVHASRCLSFTSIIVIKVPLCLGILF